MTVAVYPFPPVGVMASEWTVIDPINRSRSILTGRSYESRAQPRRRAVHLEVSALAAGRSGAGYMEVLKRLLEGGINKVSLSSRPINWHLDAALEASGRQSRTLDWTNGSAAVNWTQNGGHVVWVTGAVLQGTPKASGSFAGVEVKGLEARQLAARAGEFVQVFKDDEDDSSALSMVVRDAYADADGTALIRLLDPLPYSGRINLGASESGIFEASGMPRSVQPTGQDWSYAWDFTEVFTSEIGPFERVNPW